MNSLIWRGVSSTTISGLLISELPPISKPRMRVKETIIDGRDGSTIEELGYEPYDKPVVIGLHGNFDINKVIKYFTGEGEVVFSNEPDKVYTAKIVEYIDYNRLAKYRQATIIFRTQPYKHKLNEVYKAAPTSTAEGTSIVVSDSADANLKAFSIYGKSTQNGTPTPTAPVDIVSVGDDGIIFAGVVDKEGIIGNAFTSGGLDKVTGAEIADETLLRTGYISIKEKVVCRVSGSGSPVRVFFYTEAKEFTSSLYAITGDWFAVPNGCAFIRVHVGVTGYTTYLEINRVSAVALDSIVLKAIPVTDKSHATYTDASGQMWYADEIDIENGKLLNRSIELTVNDFIVSVSKDAKWYDSSKSYSYELYQNTKPICTEVFGYCTHLQSYSFNSFYNKAIETGCMNNQPYIVVNISKSLGICTTVEEFKQWCVNNGVKFVKFLTTPIETTFTEEQIALCKALKSNKPTTTIQNNENAFMKVEYFKPYEVFNEGLENSKPLIVLKGEGMVIVSVNGVATFEYTFPEGENEVVIDSQVEDAYLGTVLKNRNMRGEFPVLLPGTNIIEWTGAVSSIEILPRSRWL